MIRYREEDYHFDIRDTGNVLERNDSLPFGEKCQKNGLFPWKIRIFTEARNRRRSLAEIGNNPDAPAPNPSEVSAVNFENRVRVRTELPLRKRYDTKIPQSKLENPWKHKTDKK